MKWTLAFALGSILHPGLVVRDIDGVNRTPLKVESGRASVLFFVTQDCPVSNYYSHEIRRVCDEYGKKGVSCNLVYVDPTVTAAEVRKHAEEYGHGDYPKIIDTKHALVKATGADVTPTAVVVRADESIAYRGRIDNYYADFGKPRRMVTEHDLRDALDAVLAGKPVARPETKAVGCFIPDLKFY
jgi:CBS domain-containing protein